MPKFSVVYTKGRAVIRGSNVDFQTSSGRSIHEVDAETRASAFIKTYHHLTKLGLEVFVPKVPPDSGNPLGFTDSEVELVQEASVPFHSDVRHGARIEAIVEQP